MSGPLRVLFALPGFHRVARGAEAALENVARQLARRGCAVTLVGGGEPRPGLDLRVGDHPVPGEHLGHDPPPKLALGVDIDVLPVAATTAERHVGTRRLDAFRCSADDPGHGTACERLLLLDELHLDGLAREGSRDEHHAA